MTRNEFVNWLEDCEMNWRVVDEAEDCITLEYDLLDGGSEEFALWDNDGDSYGSLIYDAYMSFDVDEWVEMWLGGKGAPGARQLVKDAEEIEAALKELSEKVARVELEEERAA